MINKKVSLYILFSFIFLVGMRNFAVTQAFADSPSSSLDDKPSVDTAAVSEPQSAPSSSDVAAADSRASYLYDLKKLIDKSRQNIKEVNEKIKEQAVLKRNQKREERAREYYEKGVALTNQGRLDEAREYFEKAIRITEHPEMAGYIKESQRRLRKQEEALSAQEHERNQQIKQDQNVRKEDVEEAYREAIDLYKQKKYHPAQDAFQHVDEIAPDYRATSSYLKIIDQDIIIADAIAAKQQAVEINRQQKEAEEARTKEKSMWLTQIEEKEKERKDEINHQAEEVYDQAVALYKIKKFAESKKKFEEVSWVIPDYKATMRYLRRIDRDAEVEQKRIAAEQQKALEEQRWQEEVEHKKVEAARQQEMEVKAKQHNQDLQEQAQFIYTGAVSLFDHKDMDGALEKFNDIEKLVPYFKSTKMYIARIQQWQLDQQKSQDRKIKEAQEDKLREQQLAVDEKRASLLKEKSDQAQRVYDQALSAYRAHQWVEARAQFGSVEQIIPDFKRTRRYLQRTENAIAEAAKNNQAARQPAAPAVVQPAPVVVIPAVVATPVPVIQPIVIPVVPVAPKAAESTMPAPVQVAISIEDQQKQAQDIAALAERSAELYRQISDVADDRPTVQTKRKMAQVDEILRNLKETKERALRQIREEEWKRQEEQTKAKEEQQRTESDKIYQEGLEYFRSHEYAKARIKFMSVESIIPDYKSSRRYLRRIEEDLKRADVEAVTTHEQEEAQHLKALQDKENAAQELRDSQEEQKERDEKVQQQMQLQTLAQKASQINDDIIGLSKTQDYEGMKVKFTELESTVAALTTLKDTMAKNTDRQERDKELARQEVHRRNDMERAQKRQDQEIHAYYRVEPKKEYRPVLSTQPSDLEQYKNREIMQEQNNLFSEAVDRYEHKKYSQAKLLFGELADQNDRRAEVWLKKVDRAITRELLRSQEGEVQERTAFIADQINAQRELFIIQERERQRQKRLTEELERQTRLYEDERLLQLRKEEILKSQDRERQRHEQMRLKLQQQLQKKQTEYRFHKIMIVPKLQPEVKIAPVAGMKLVVHPIIVSPVPAITAQVQAQIDFSSKRKAFLEEKYKKEKAESDRLSKIKADAEARQKLIEQRQELRSQWQKARQARIKAAQDARDARIKAQAEARQKRMEARQKELEHRKELLAQREQERQARSKAEAEERQKIAQEKQKEIEHSQEIKAEQERQEAARLDEEKKHQQEVLEEQAQARAEQMKQDEIMRQETERKKALEDQERQAQAQLEAQRESVRKQLEDGVESMYQDALSLYKQGDYASAADRFKDVQDIIPGYKRSAQYMEDSRQKSMSVSPQAVSVPNVSKTLDL